MSKAIKHFHQFDRESWLAFKSRVNQYMLAKHYRVTAIYDYGCGYAAVYQLID